jgi:G3E family GTPase
VKQIHEQDCYARIGPAGGIRAVLPVHDVATYSTMVTLVNLDSTVSTTSNSVDFYDDQIARFKVLLMNKSGDAA